ncbi:MULTISPECIES: hypothetical protein [unclassified Luteococcus]|uniref:hypothetical protein n=1 Tax=unclassified Luteococcus TaxID=2639923 RepID=UPI00313D2569
MEEELNRILQELAAGRIDADEAGRRIDAITAAAAGVNGGVRAEDEQPGAAQDPGRAEETQAAEDPGEVTWGAIARDLFGAATGIAQSAAMGAAHTVEETLHQPAAPKHQPSPDPVTPVHPEGSHGVQRIMVRATGRRVRIIGDATIATLAADGPHVLRRSGAVLEVTSDGDLAAGKGGFSVLRSPLTSSLLNQGLGGLKNLNLEDLREIGLGKELLLRINPNIPVDVEVTAGSLSTLNVPWLGRVRVTAGGAQLGDVRQVSDALVQAGSVTARGHFDKGRSRVRVESGNLTVQLTEGAHVAVHADAHLGRITWPGGAGPLDEYLAGEGTGRLDLAVVMGAASVQHEAVPVPDDQQQHEQKDGDL